MKLHPIEEPEGSREGGGGGYSIMQVEGNERLLGGRGSAPSRLAGWAPVA